MKEQERRDYWHLAVGMILGMLIAIVGVQILTPERTRAERERDYEAYTVCIPKPNCMKAADFIDFYNLKWRLESE